MKYVHNNYFAQKSEINFLQESQHQWMLLKMYTFSFQPQKTYKLFFQNCQKVCEMKFEGCWVSCTSTTVTFICVFVEGDRLKVHLPRPSTPGQTEGKNTFLQNEPTKTNHLINFDW